MAAVLVALALLLTFAPEAGARGAAPAPDGSKLAAYLPIARAAWPASPCAGHEVVHVNADRWLAAQAVRRHSLPMAGYSSAATCTTWIASRLGRRVFCDTLTHELGHLAGYGHTDDPSARHPDGPMQLAVMFSVGGNYPPCDDAIAAAANTARTALASAGWVAQCGESACIARRRGSPARRYDFDEHGALGAWTPATAPRARGRA